MHYIWQIRLWIMTDTLHSLIVTGWRRLIRSPKLQIISHKTATKCRPLLRKMTYKDKGSYESSPPCTCEIFQEICYMVYVKKVLLCDTTHSPRTWYVTWLILYGLGMWHDLFSTDSRDMTHSPRTWYVTWLIFQGIRIRYTSKRWFYVSWLILQGIRVWHDSFFKEFVCDKTDSWRNLQVIYVPKVLVCDMTHSSKNSYVKWHIHKQLHTWHDSFFRKFVRDMTHSSRNSYVICHIHTDLGAWHDSQTKELGCDITHPQGIHRDLHPKSYTPNTTSLHPQL